MSEKQISGIQPSSSPASGIKLSIVIPCYNEEKNLPELAERFAKVMRPGFELILVDNGSYDQSASVLASLALRPEYSFIRTTKVEKNIGYGYGILHGLREARGEYVAYTHADLQCEPSDVILAYGKLLASASPACTLVKGERQNRHDILSILYHLISSTLFLHHYNDINGQPKVFPRALLEEMKEVPKDFAFDFYVQHVAVRNKYSVLAIPVQFAVRKHGESKWATSIPSKINPMARYFFYLLKVRFGIRQDTLPFHDAHNA